MHLGLSQYSKPTTLAPLDRASRSNSRNSCSDLIAGPRRTRRPRLCAFFHHGIKIPHSWCHVPSSESPAPSILRTPPPNRPPHRVVIAPRDPNISADVPEMSDDLDPAQAQTAEEPPETAYRDEVEGHHLLT